MWFGIVVGKSYGEIILGYSLPIAPPEKRNGAS
jgi:hypothetical protein